MNLLYTVLVHWRILADTQLEKSKHILGLSHADIGTKVRFIKYCIYN